MPPETGPASRARKWKKLKISITGLVNELRRFFSKDAQRTKESSEALRAKLRKQISMIHKLQQSELGGDSSLDTLGTNLWNQCTQLGRECAGDGNDAGRSTDSTSSIPSLVRCGRVIACQIFHLTQWTEALDWEGVAHLMKIALRAAKSCIDGNDLDLAQVAMALAGQYCPPKEKQTIPDGLLHGHHANATAKGSDRLRSEYLSLRLALAWKEDRLDVARELFPQAEELLACIDPGSTESLAEVLFMIGKHLFEDKKDIRHAVEWLDRSNSALEAREFNSLSPVGKELKLSILQIRVKALLALGETAAFEKAQSAVAHVETLVGGEMMFILILHLDLLNRSPAEVFDSDSYASVLRQMIEKFNKTDMSNVNFKLLDHHLRKLHEKSPGLGIRIADEFLTSLQTNRLYLQNPGWYEKLVIERVWMASKHRDSIENVNETQEAFGGFQKPLSAKAAVSAQALIWKILDTSYNQGKYDLAMGWCHLALLPVFQNSGPLNLAKIERKLLLCQISLNNLPAALSVFHGMSDQTQKDSMTRYLAYKVAVRSQDRELASECLEIISGTAENGNLLYACVLDAQRAGHLDFIIDAMKVLMQKHNYKNTSTIRIPALYRCTIRLLDRKLRMKSGSAEIQPIVEDICNVFDTAATAIEQNPTDSQGNKLFNATELEWFCRNAYNLGVKNSGEWDPRSVVRLLDNCIAIIANLPRDATSTLAGDLTLRRAFCHYLSASALTALARKSDRVESQLQDYMALRRHVAAFEEGAMDCKAKLDRSDRSLFSNLLKKLSVLLVFDFEAATHLRLWGQLGEVVRRAAVCENERTFQCMGDCLLRAQVPPQEFYSTMRLIVNELSGLDSFDAVKLAKYMRCLFQATLAMDATLAFGLLEEACQMASEAADTESSAWPSEEVNWMAVTAFNHAIDCFGHGEDKPTRMWAQTAMRLARYCDDGESLVESMQKNYSKLKLGYK